MKKVIDKHKPTIIVLDLESTLFPEIWIAIAEQTGIDGLKLTTRDIGDFTKLMNHRIKLLRENNLHLKEIKAIAKKLKPLKGAASFLQAIRKKFPAIILSDTFFEFAQIILPELNYPTVFCHSFKIKNGKIVGYHIRQSSKQDVVSALRKSGFQVVAVGDSYNDLGMLHEADLGLFFNASKEIAAENKNIKSFYSYPKLLKFIEKNCK